MSFQSFLDQIGKGLPANVYLFYASDPFLLREAFDAIKLLVPETERDFNLHVFDLSAQGEESTSFGQVLDVASTVSFFGGRRFTVLSGNLQKLLKKDLERVYAYRANPAKDSVLVMLHNGGLTREGREKFRELKPLSLDIRESDISFWIQKRARTKGMELSEEAIDFLIGLKGPDIGLLAAEIEKISLLGRKKITPDDISDIVAGGRAYSIFDLVTALTEKDSERVFKMYKTLRETSDDYSLIGALNWQYGRTAPEAVKQGSNDYFFKVFELLHGVDKDIKSSGRIFPMEYLLVRLLRLQEGRLPSS
jgi:DNA polymerase III delta subunit